MFGIFISKFIIFKGPICSKEETVMSCIKTSVAHHSFIRRREGNLCEVGEIFAVNQSAFPTENKEGDGS